MGMTMKFVEIKLCRTCKKNLNYKKFRKVNSLKKGPNKGKFVGWTDINGGKRFSTCSECEKDRFYKRYRSNPIPQLIYNFKKRAKLAGVPFDLEPQDIKNKLNLTNTKCPVLGVNMEISKLGSKNNDLTPSIDRIDPKKGYVKDNIIVVSMRANRIKNDATVDEIRKVADFYEKLQKNK
jgi:hypothetical protein